MKRKDILIWGIGGVCIGILIGLATSKDLFEEESRYVQNRKEIKVSEIKNIENKEPDKAKLIKEYKYDRDIEYNDIKYENETLFFKSYLFNITEDMQFRDGLNIDFDGEKLSWVMEIGNKFYGVLPDIEKANIEIKENKIINKKTEKETELEAFLIEFKLDENDRKLKEIKREKKTFEEYLKEKDTKKYGEFYSSEVEEYETKTLHKVEKEREMALNLIKDEYKVYETEHIEVFNSENRYYMVLGFDKLLEPVYVIGDRKENKEYVVKPENTKIEIKSMFYYDNKILGADRFGNILEVNIEEDKVEIKELSENTVRQKNQGEFHLLGMVNEYVYFRNYLPIDSLIVYNAKKDEFSVVYESNIKTMDGIDMKDGYISLYIEPGARAQKIVGKLKGDKIEIVIDEISKVKGSKDFIYKDILIMEALDDATEVGHEYGTEIKIYKLK